MTDKLSEAMDQWQMRQAVQLQYLGHNFDRAWLLARYSRDMLEADLRKGSNLIVVTGA